MQSKHFLAKKLLKQSLLKIKLDVLEDCAESPTSSNNTCPICLDPCSDVAALDCCMHKFCFSCISAWGKITPRCPLCKLLFQSAVFSATTSSAGKTFRPLHPSIETKISYEDDEDVEDELENDFDFGYEMDGFVVDEDDLEFFEYSDETEDDRILAKADEVLLSRKRKRRPEISNTGNENYGRRAVDRHHYLTDDVRDTVPNPAVRLKSSSVSFDNFLKSCESTH